MNCLIADNLLLTANQKSVKLADFGLAREETVTEMMTAETGTYRWMAPEVCKHVYLDLFARLFYVLIKIFHLVQQTSVGECKCFSNLL